MLPRRLTSAQRGAFFLRPKAAPAAIELNKWPYYIPEWKSGSATSDTRAGKSPPVPTASQTPPRWGSDRPNMRRGRSTLVESTLIATDPIS
jgi:hypothetical protein